LIRKSESEGVIDCNLPASMKYSYDNYLAQIISNGNNFFNFALSNGYQTNTGAPQNTVVGLNPPKSIVKKVSVWCGTGTIVGI
jgi:hypothetical protein